MTRLEQALHWWARNEAVTDGPVPGRHAHELLDYGMVHFVFDDDGDVLDLARAGKIAVKRLGYRRRRGWKGWHK